MWTSGSAPNVPAFEPIDYRVESAVVLIQTRHGGLYTARWVVYQDSEYSSVWELEGRDGQQLDPEEVVAWQSITPFGGEG